MTNPTPHFPKYRSLIGKALRGTATALLLASTLFATSCSCSDSKEKSDAEATSQEVLRRRKPDNYRMPADMSHLRKDLHRHLAEVFNDSNRYQYAHAVYLGIDPIHDIGDSYNTNRPLVKITDSQYYKLDSLTHSMPYLVPEAAKLLNDIGRNFRDSLKRQGIPLCRLRITSLLRTKASVKRLRRVNRNATDSSTHQFATTFDLAYNNFFATAGDEKVTNPHYREVLGEVLYDLRARNRCMVKYERKSPCFHITVIQ